MDNELRIKNLIIFLIILGLISPSFIFAQNQKVEPPENPEEVKEMGEKALETAKNDLPGILERIWKEEAIPFWQKMFNELRSFLAPCFTRAWDWAKNCWKNTLWPWIKGFWERRIKPPVEEEVEKRKDIVEEKIRKEKEELQEELIPETTKSLWENLKN